MSKGSISFDIYVLMRFVKSINTLNQEEMLHCVSMISYDGDYFMR